MTTWVGMGNEQYTGVIRNEGTSEELEINHVVWESPSGHS